MKKTILGIMFIIFMLISVTAVSAQHTPSADLSPLWSPASTNVDYTVDICNEDGSTDSLWRMEIIKNYLYDDFDCEDLDGWSKSLITFYDPEFQAVTEMCQYNALSPSVYIVPNTCVPVIFSAKTPSEEDCNLMWKFRTYDEEDVYGGDWETTRSYTGVDSIDPIIVKTLSSKTAGTTTPTYGPCLPAPNSDEECWLTDDAVITFNAYDPGDATCAGDGVIPSGMNYCTVKVLVDGVEDTVYTTTIEDNGANDLDFDVNSITYSLSFLEDTEHDLVIECFDVARNSFSDTENFRVDMLGPKTSIDLEAGTVYHTDDIVQWLDTDSAISLSAFDYDPNNEFACSIRGEEIYYREFYFGPDNNNAWAPCWTQNACDNFNGGPSEPETTHQVQYTPFNLYDDSLLNPGAESCHVIEAYAVDAFGNEGTLVRECYFVDKTAPETTLSLDGTSIFWDETIGAADRILDLQDGSWDWVVTDDTTATGAIYQNLAGVTANVLLDAYKLTGDMRYLDGAIEAGDYLISDIGTPNLGSSYNAFSPVFLYDLTDVTEDNQYADLADDIMNHVLNEKNYWSLNNGNHCSITGCSATELRDAYINFRGATSIPNGFVVYDLSTFVDAAQNFGDDTFATSVATEIDLYMSQTSFDNTVSSYELGLATGIIALEQADVDSSTYVDLLKNSQLADGSFNGEIQVTAYAIMGLELADEFDASEKAAIYLEDNFGYNSLAGWLESDNAEYSEITSEAAQALADVLARGIPVRLSTGLTLTCNDPEPHPAGGEVLNWAIFVDNGDGWVEESSDVDSTNVVLEFENPSMHKIEWSCHDAVGKTSDSFSTLFKVDEEAPVITKTVTGEYSSATTCPPVNGFIPDSDTDSDACFLKGTEAVVHVAVEDFVVNHMTNNVECHYEVKWENLIIEYGIFGEEGKSFSWVEDSQHILTIECDDLVGNHVKDVEYFLVDIIAPVTTSTIGPSESVYQEDSTSSLYVDTATRMILDATDNKIGVEDILYRLVYPTSDDFCKTTCDSWDGSSDLTEFTSYVGEFAFPTEACTVVEYYSVDKLGNTENINWECMFVDKTKPIANVAVGTGASITCESLGDDSCDASWVTTDTEIDLFCDFDSLETNPSPLNNLYYQVKVDDNGWGDIVTLDVTNDMSMKFSEDSYHSIKVWCDDKVGKISDEVIKTFRVDTTAPSIDLILHKPFFGDCDLTNDDHGECFVDTATRIELSVEDGGNICAIGDKLTTVACQWKYSVKDGNYYNSTDWMDYDSEALISFPEESLHTLIVLCKDALGNTKEVKDFFSVDKTAPSIAIGLDVTPFYNGTGLFVAPGDNGTGLFVAPGDNALVTVTDVGAHLSGVAKTEWKLTTVTDNNDPCNSQAACDLFVGDDDFATFENALSGSVTYPGESCHILEVKTTDNVGKFSTMNKCVFVDATAPTTAKVIGIPHSAMSEGNQELGSVFYPELMESGFCDELNKCVDVTLLTPINLACNDPAPHPSGAVDVCFMVDFDGEDLTQKYCGDNTLNENGYCCVNGPVSNFMFGEESWHKLSYYCTDNVGNVGFEDLDVEYFKVEGTAFEIELNKKWNLISVPVKLLDDSMADVLAGHEHSVEAVWTYEDGEWFVYSPDGEDNDNLHTMLPGWGYWILAHEDDMLTIGGSLFSPATTPVGKTIVPGWNLLGYYGAEMAPIGSNGIPGYYGPAENGLIMAAEFDSLTSNVWDKNSPSVWSYWEEYNPNQWLTFDSGKRMDPGAGYWVYAYDDGMFVPPTNVDYNLYSVLSQI